MAKAVVYAFLTTAFVIFMIFSPEKTRNHDINSSSPLLNRRFGFDSLVPTFDPLVAKMEILLGDELPDHHNDAIFSQNNTTSEKDVHHHHHQHHRDEAVEEAYDQYLNAEGRFNISLRLMHLFPLVDVDPKDGLISLQELKAWNVIQTSERLNYISKKEFELRDTNRDGLIGFNEYFPQFSEEQIGTYEN